MAMSAGRRRGALSKRAQAKLLAKAIREELAFPFSVRASDKSKMVNKLWDEPPARSDLSFQTKQHDTPELTSAPKQALAGDIGDEDALDEINELFCMAHGEFVTISGTDIEHATPFRIIRENQQKILSLLNQDKTLAKQFLRQEGMSDFFRQDRKDKVIKGTSYFYKLCYNNISNLWLLCHACNIHKSDGDPLTWFADQKEYFGQKFLDAIGPGGLKEGLLFHQVHGSDVIEIGKSPNKLSVVEGGEGFGAFTRKWFLKQHGDELKIQKQFRTVTYRKLRDSLEDLRALKDTEPDEYKNMLRKIRTNLGLEEAYAEGLRRASIAAGRASSSSSASVISPQREVDRHKRVVATSYRVGMKVHVIDTSIAPLIKELYDEGVWNELRHDVQESSACELAQLKDIRTYLMALKAECNVKKLDLPLREEFIQKIKEMAVPKPEAIIQRLQQEVDRLRADNAKKDEVIQDLSEAVRKTGRLHTESAAEVRVLRATVMDKDRTISSLRDQVGGLEAKVAENNEEIEGLRGKVGGLSRRLEDLTVSDDSGRARRYAGRYRRRLERVSLARGVADAEVDEQDTAEEERKPGPGVE